MKKMIERNEKIEVYYDNQNKKTEIYLDKRERFVKDYKNIDVTIIEIFPEDYFLLPNLDYTDDYSKLINKNIYIPNIL